jgi:hypothetical protein
LLICAFWLGTGLLALFLLVNYPLGVLGVAGLIGLGVLIHKLNMRWQEERKWQRTLQSAQLEKMSEKLEHDLREDGYYLPSANDAVRRRNEGRPSKPAG